MTLVSRKGEPSFFSVHVLLLTLFALYSYLKGLIPGFNKCVDKFLQKLDPLADGKTRVPLVARFSEVSLDVLSKVCV